jgi:hypothetical protein
MNKYIALDFIIKKQLDSYTEQQKENLLYGFMLDKYNKLPDEDIVQFIKLVCNITIENLED